MTTGRMGLIGSSIAIAALGLGGCSSGGSALPAATVAAEKQGITDRDLSRKEWRVETHAVSGAYSPPSPAGALTLKSAIKRALTYNPSLKAALIEIEGKHGEEAQAGVKPNPELALDVADFAGTKNKADFQTAQETLQITQLIELGDKRLARLRSAHLDAAVSVWDYETVRVQVATLTAEFFVDALSAQERVKVLKNFVAVAEKTRSSVNARVKAGKSNPIELDRATVSLARAKSAVAAEQLRFETARRRLSALWGADQIDFTSVDGNLNGPQFVPSLDNVKIYLSENPNIARWSDEIGRRYAVLDVERSKSIPDVKLGVGLRTFQENDAVAAVASMSVPLQIFDTNSGNIAAAERRIAKAENDKEAARGTLTSSLYEVLGALKIAASQTRSLQNEVLPAAENAFEKTQFIYDEGKIDLLNVLDTQRTLFEVRLDLVNARAEYHKAKVQVEALIGRQLEGL